MSFKIWIEDQEVSLGGMSPEVMVGRGSDTPASDEVKRTNLQPQVDAQEPESSNSDQIAAIDSGLAHLEKEMPQNSEDDKVNEFKKLWDNMKRKWDAVKTKKSPPQEEEGLGVATGDPRYLQAMQNAPNMVPARDNQPHGPGIMGNS